MSLTGTLCKKGENIAGDKNLGHPGGPDQRVFFGLQQTDQACQNHVNGGSEERRAEED